MPSTILSATEEDKQKAKNLENELNRVHMAQHCIPGQKKVTTLNEMCRVILIIHGENDICPMSFNHFLLNMKNSLTAEYKQTGKWKTLVKLIFMKCNIKQNTENPRTLFL